MAKAGVEFKRVTKGKGLSAVVKNTKDAFVKVGVLQGQGEHPNGDHGQTIAEIAFWNEFGTARIPPRPFLRSTLKERKLKYKALFAKILKAILNQRLSSQQGIGRIGLRVSSDIQQKITTLTSPPNAYATIVRKGGKQNPLLDSGTLRRSISWEVLR